jgi:hypothetical protein
MLELAWKRLAPLGSKEITLARVRVGGEGEGEGWGWGWG